jgi:hypothetical protein
MKPEAFRSFSSNTRNISHRTELPTHYHKYVGELSEPYLIGDQKCFAQKYTVARAILFSASATRTKKAGIYDNISESNGNAPIREEHSQKLTAKMYHHLNGSRVLTNSQNKTISMYDTITKKKYLSANSVFF